MLVGPAVLCAASLYLYVSHCTSGADQVEDDNRNSIKHHLRTGYDKVSVWFHSGAVFRYLSSDARVSINFWPRCCIYILQVP